jgi:hypothetical protein
MSRYPRSYANTKKAFVMLLISVAFAEPANAIQCSVIDFDESFDAASQVVVGRFEVAQLVPGSTSKYSLSFSVLDVLKGPASDKIELGLDQERYLDPDAYTAGVRYLLFLQTGQTNIHICEKIVVLDGGAASWLATWKNSAALALAQARACLERSPTMYQSVGGSPLRLASASAQGPGAGKKQWLVHIPEETPSTVPHGLDLFVDPGTGECLVAPMD